ncbi:hypothetical protein AK88_04717 [Plasmodium fragile]|uniref:Schizont-infected cell agglutination extracellular alpha domain-containing protein n=1 Tax=Plasmodium fragile TaxID=5857 RepID=A0A0D9QF40_PLAFR|nr:uncharacterized protein AK88_04717 [Plasmodium fragile]KJP85645.1 hypothetical protein AK88_04717 [Plasmodium fragile]
MDLESLGANCMNAYYKHPQYPDGPPRQVTRAGDRIMCKLMVGALYFMNDNSWPTRGGSMGVSNDDELREYVRCAIVNMYMDILKESSCGGEWGLYYAWYTMKQLEEGPGGGLISQGKCGQGVFENIKASEWDMGKKIKDWLWQNSRTTRTIARSGLTSKCSKAISDIDKVHNAGTTDSLNVLKEGLEKEIGDTLKAAMKSVMTQIRKEVKAKIKGSGDKAPGSTLEPPSDSEEDDTGELSDSEEDKEQDHYSSLPASSSLPGASTGRASTISKSAGGVAAAKPPDARATTQATETPTTPSPKEPTGKPRAGPELGDTGGERSQSVPKAPASPVLPARPPPPPPPRRPSTPRQGSDPGRQAAGTAGASTDTKVKDSDAKPPGTAPCPDSNSTSGGVSIRCGSTSDSDLGLTDDVRKLLQAQDTRENAPTSPNPSSGTGESSSVHTAHSLKQELKKQEKKNETTIFLRERERHHGERETTQRARNQTSNKNASGRAIGQATGNDPPAVRTTTNQDPSVATAAPAPGPAPPQNPASTTTSTSSGPEGAPASSSAAQPGPPGGSDQNAGAQGTQGSDPMFHSEPITDSPAWYTEFDTGGTGTTSSGGTQRDSADGAQNAGDVKSGNLDCTNNTPDKGCGPYFSLTFTPDATSLGGSFVPPNPESEIHVLHADTRYPPKEGGPDVPDLTDTVLTATTPILLFVAAVIVALLGYSLWKISAHTSSCTTRTQRINTAQI